VKPEINAICTIMIAVVAIGVIAAASMSKRNATMRARAQRAVRH
jgi:putrescine transport system permease protein